MSLPYPSIPYPISSADLPVAPSTNTSILSAAVNQPASVRVQAFIAANRRVGSIIRAETDPIYLENVSLLPDTINTASSSSSGPSIPKTPTKISFASLQKQWSSTSSSHSSRKPGPGDEKKLHLQTSGQRNLPFAQISAEDRAEIVKRYCDSGGMRASKLYEAFSPSEYAMLPSPLKLRLERSCRRGQLYAECHSLIFTNLSTELLSNLSARGQTLLATWLCRKSLTYTFASRLSMQEIDQFTTHLPTDLQMRFYNQFAIEMEEEESVRALSPQSRNIYNSLTSRLTEGLFSSRLAQVLGIGVTTGFDIERSSWVYLNRIIEEDGIVGAITHEADGILSIGVEKHGDEQLIEKMAQEQGIVGDKDDIFKALQVDEQFLKTLEERTLCSAVFIIDEILTQTDNASLGWVRGKADYHESQRMGLVPPQRIRAILVSERYADVAGVIRRRWTSIPIYLVKSKMQRVFYPVRYKNIPEGFTVEIVAPDFSLALLEIFNRNGRMPIFVHTTRL